MIFSTNCSDTCPIDKCGLKFKSRMALIKHYTSDHKEDEKKDIIMKEIPTVISSQKPVDKSKGRLISECLFDILNFPNKQRKDLTNF